MKTNIKLMVLLFLTLFSIQAQQKLNKAVQTVKVNNDVTVELNTSHTNIEVDTWNKDYLEVEAYIESKKLTKEELKTFLRKWKIEVNGSGNYVSIDSKGSSGLWDSDMNLELFENESLEALSNMDFDLDLNLKSLLESLKGLESLKDLPEALKVLRIPESPDGNYNLDFDFDRYQEEGEKYLDIWSKKYRKKYGAEYEQEMREWAKSIKQSDLDKFEKEMTIWGENFGEEFGKKFEKEFAPAIEKW
ncbi:MAG: hypothetical protein QNK89_03990 [Lacinutrix sp.]|uniref:hypothetical protein n=1 Tax=Lacinutrix sp. TaxID=1937692 RepID=UPI0030B0CB46